jgi:hypothetical protein
METKPSLRQSLNLPKKTTVTQTSAQTTGVTMVKTVFRLLAQIEKATELTLNGALAPLSNPTAQNSQVLNGLRTLNALASSKETSLGVWNEINTVETLNRVRENIVDYIVRRNKHGFELNTPLENDKIAQELNPFRKASRPIEIEFCSKSNLAPGSGKLGRATHIREKLDKMPEVIEELIYTLTQISLGVRMENNPPITEVEIGALQKAEALLSKNGGRKDLPSETMERLEKTKTNSSNSKPVLNKINEIFETVTLDAAAREQLTRETQLFLSNKNDIGTELENLDELQRSSVTAVENMRVTFETLENAKPVNTKELNHNNPSQIQLAIFQSIREKAKGLGKTTTLVLTQQLARDSKFVNEFLEKGADAVLNADTYKRLTVITEPENSLYGSIVENGDYVEEGKTIHEALQILNRVDAFILPTLSLDGERTKIQSIASRILDHGILSCMDLNKNQIEIEENLLSQLQSRLTQLLSKSELELNVDITDAKEKRSKKEKQVEEAKAKVKALQVKLAEKEQKTTTEISVFEAAVEEKARFEAELIETEEEIEILVSTVQFKKEPETAASSALEIKIGKIRSNIALLKEEGALLPLIEETRKKAAAISSTIANETNTGFDEVEDLPNKIKRKEDYNKIQETIVNLLQVLAKPEIRNVIENLQLEIQEELHQVKSEINVIRLAEEEPVEIDEIHKLQSRLEQLPEPQKFNAIETIFKHGMETLETERKIEERSRTLGLKNLSQLEAMQSVYEHAKALNLESFNLLKKALYLNQKITTLSAIKIFAEHTENLQSADITGLLDAINSNKGPQTDREHALISLCENKATDGTALKTKEILDSLQERTGIKDLTKILRNEIGTLRMWREQEINLIPSKNLEVAASLCKLPSAIKGALRPELEKAILLYTCEPQKTLGLGTEKIQEKETTACNQIYSQIKNGNGQTENKESHLPDKHVLLKEEISSIEKEIANIDETEKPSRELVWKRQNLETTLTRKTTELALSRPQQPKENKEYKGQQLQSETLACLKRLHTKTAEAIKQTKSKTELAAAVTKDNSELGKSRLFLIRALLDEPNPTPVLQYLSAWNAMTNSTPHQAKEITRNPLIAKRIKMKLNNLVEIRDHLRCICEDPNTLTEVMLQQKRTEKPNPEKAGAWETRLETSIDKTTQQIETGEKVLADWKEKFNAIFEAPAESEEIYDKENISQSKRICQLKINQKTKEVEDLVIKKSKLKELVELTHTFNESLEDLDGSSIEERVKTLMQPKTGVTNIGDIFNSINLLPTEIQLPKQKSIPSLRMEHFLEGATVAKTNNKIRELLNRAKTCLLNHHAPVGHIDIKTETLKVVTRQLKEATFLQLRELEVKHWESGRGLDINSTEFNAFMQDPEIAEIKKTWVDERTHLMQTDLIGVVEYASSIPKNKEKEKRKELEPSMA